MRNQLMAGVWRFMVGVPPILWEKRIEKARYKVMQATSFMSPEHRLVHHFVVREMPRMGAPVPAETVARALAVPLERVTEILQDLEERLTFLYRNKQGQVVWAYPVTIEKTPHSITVTSECAHCKKPIQIEIDSDMNYQCRESGCRPMIFVPEVDLRRLKDPNIIEAF